MLISIILPLLNFVWITLLGRFIGKLGSIYLTIYLYLINFIYNCKLAYSIFSTNNVYFVWLGPWINCYLFDTDWEFIFDTLAITIIVMVNFISLLVHLYSISYISNDPYFIRFLSYLSLFTFFIFVLVSAGNIFLLFLGWEGVGLCSYLLINFWSTRIQANKAALKAMIMNRIGDIALLVGIFWLCGLFGTCNFIVLPSLLSAHLSIGFFNGCEKELPFHYCYICFTCFILFIGVIGKSAQIGLHTWLPAAIEGPTPVSALIHAATIVTAGVFLILRLSFVFYYSYHVQVLIIIVGCLTALISAITAFFLYDIKKIIAYSTCSQLGYIVVACGLLQFNYSLFHLINHAFFKALLFLTAGAIIHSFNNEQDIRRYSNIFIQIPFLYTCIIVGNIAIIGVPFLSGFYSKDLIIEFAYLNGSLTFNCNFIFSLLLVATSFTAAYSLRLYYFLFLRTTLKVGAHSYIKQTSIIQIVLSFLIIFSILSGYFFHDLFQPSINFFSSDNFSRRYNLDVKLITSIVSENEFLPNYIKLLPLIVNVLLGIGIYLTAWHSVRFNIRFSSFFLRPINRYTYFINPLVLLINKRFVQVTMGLRNNLYFNEIYNFVALLNFYYCFHFIVKNVDKGFLELIGPTGLNKIYLRCLFSIAKLYEHNLRQFLFVMYNTFIFYYFIFEYFIF